MVRWKWWSCTSSAEVEVIPRRVSVQYENAIYHVTYSGRSRRWIYHDDEYYESFLLTLEEAHDGYEATFHACRLIDRAASLSDELTTPIEKIECIKLVFKKSLWVPNLQSHDCSY